MKISQLFSIEGKIALITGATGGLGSIYAEGLAENGATVVLNGRNKSKLDIAVNKLKSNGYKAYSSIFDVTKSDEIKLAVSEIEDEIGPIDILINNAGINLRAPLDQFSDEDWETVIGINLTGTYKVSIVN